MIVATRYWVTAAIAAGASGDPHPAAEGLDTILQPVGTAARVSPIHEDIEVEGILALAHLDRRASFAAGSPERVEPAQVDGHRDLRGHVRAGCDVHGSIPARIARGRAQQHSETAGLERRGIDPLRKERRLVHRVLHAAS